ncbi:MAG: hypothetical protein K2W94_08645 [Alphaproteobacteria bacterium]|nr:hypothetical protein [Alphaproteobacteria bacterium]
MLEYVFSLDHLHILPNGEEDWKGLGAIEKGTLDIDTDEEILIDRSSTYW